MFNKARAIKHLFADVSLGAPDNAVGFVLWRVFHRYQREIDRALVALDLTNLQFTTLALVAWLGRSGKTVPQSELSRFADIHPMQLSLMLKSLAEKDMVTRVRDPSDTRAKTVEITETGLAALRAALPIAISVQERVFGEGGRPGGSLLNALLALGED